MSAEPLSLKPEQGFLAELAGALASAQPARAPSATAPAPGHPSYPLARPVLAPAEPAMPRWKRTLDLVVIALTAPVWLPLMALIALGIKLMSPGPVLYRQKRIGYLGQPFQCLKFRTMKVNADPQPHQAHAARFIRSPLPMTKLDLKGDQRLIPLGWLLRALGLDELPQLWNVIRGEMSLVGPRPCTDYEFAHYLPRHLQRFLAVPGLTGLWQVNGKNRTTFEEMVRLDIEYARRKSLGLDLLILAKTLPVLLAQLHECLRRSVRAARPAHQPPRCARRLRPGR